MNISTLKYFKLIVENQNISKVAENESISQSALSQIIQRLENDLGFKLLNRSNKGVHPTDMGEIVYRYADLLLRMYDKMLEEIQSTQHQVRSVRVTGYPSFINYSFPCVIHKLKKQFPHLRFELRGNNNEDSISDLIQEISDLSFVCQRFDDDRIETLPIGKERMVLVANYKSNIPTSIPLNQLGRYDLILLDDAFNLREVLFNKLKREGLPESSINILFEVDSIAAAKSAILNHSGISFLPYMSVKKELYERSFKIIEIEHFDMDYNIYLCIKKEKDAPHPYKAVIDYIMRDAKNDFC